MNRRILIVDDEPNVRLNFRTTLETEGYEVFEVGSGEEAVQSLAEHTFALAILDIRMPGMDGLELLAKIRGPDDLRSIVAEIVKRHAGRDEPPGDTFNAHINAAKRCLNLRAFAKARLHLAKALELNAKSAEAFNLAGVLAEVLEDYDKAKKYYGQAIKLNKNYEPAQQNMRRLFEVDHFGSSKEPVNLGDK
jgi:CheY-like chemotaxis protein